MHLRFAVGEVPEEHKEEIAHEEATYGSFLHIPLQVTNLSPCPSSRRSAPPDLKQLERNTDSLMNEAWGMLRRQVPCSWQAHLAAPGI